MSQLLRFQEVTEKKLKQKVCQHGSKFKRFVKCSKNHIVQNKYFFEAGTEVGPDQLGPPVQVRSTRIDLDGIKNIKIKWKWTWTNQKN